MLVVGLFIGVRALVSKKKREVTPEEKLLERKKKRMRRDSMELATLLFLEQHFLQT